MGYNVLSGSVSVTHLTSVSGSFTGDGSGLENVEQFELFSAADTRIPFFKLVSGELALEGNSGFIFNNNALTVPGLTSSVGIKIANPISGTLAGTGSFIGLDSDGNMVLTSSGGAASGGGPSNSLQFHTTGGLISGSSNLLFSSNILTANCGLVFKRQQVTSTMTASATDYFLGVSASAPITIQMPGADTLSSGQNFVIKDESGNAGIHNITIKSSGSQTIDGETTIILESSFASINIYTNGSDKFFIY
jgi:hypothetical protein